jgi:predicted regulator of Ras-like GTPase activity (Roadblock/LC7/MglB family)
MTVALLPLADNLVQATRLRPWKRVYVGGLERGDVVLVPVGTEAMLTALANQEAQLGQVLERRTQTATELTGMI